MKLMPDEAILAIDLGGSKIAAALVKQGCIVERASVTTQADAGADEWVHSMLDLARAWHGTYAAAGVAVTGRIHAGLWSALNPLTLAVPNGFPLVDRLAEGLGCPVLASNDAQAAAWGEYCHGAGQGTRNLVFLTVSTGIGGGFVLDGRLLRGHTGLAGHVGQIPMGEAGEPWENRAAGRWFHAMSGCDAVDVFRAAADGSLQSDALIEQSAAHVARLCESLQAILDPERIVLGGGIGLADAYLRRVEKHIATSRSGSTVQLVRAALGVDAGLIGVAELARSGV